MWRWLDPWSVLSFRHGSSLAGFVLLNIFLSVTCVNALNCRILSIDASTTPRIEDGRVFFTLEILFDSRPANFWMYPDPTNKQLVIEVFDGIISADSFSLPRRSPFGSPRLETFTNHRKSISGKHSLILIPIDPKWECTLKNQGDASVIIYASKKLKRSLIPPSHKVPVSIRYLILYPLVSAAVGVATVGIIFLLNEG